MARSEPARAQPRTQSGVAVSADGLEWHLLNASPDLLTQIQRFAPLQAHTEPIRNTPIQGIFLTNADLDHTLGLSLLREGNPLTIYGTQRVCAALTDGIGLLPMLERYCGVDWREASFENTELCNRLGKPRGLRVQAFNIPGSAPKYHKAAIQRAHGDSVGYTITDALTGGCLVFAPDVSIIEAEHGRMYERADVLLFDGTFWSEDEMQSAGTGTTRAAQMGHLPISGSNGSLAVLKELRAKHRVYMHINNTNPILIEDSAERREVEECGIKVGEDGMEFEV